ncbi:MAG: hypothetical protein GYB68_03490 [Chloroflexi bacterium]|nr:hypothetical protein [Chloroflexota bacterium]
MADEFEYHFLILAPGLQAAWFFQAARRYWQRFQPIVTDDWALLSYIPGDAPVAVTLLARSDTAAFAQVQIEALRPGVRLDMVVVDDLTLMESVLNSRAEASLPFG